jgi:RNA-binding protein
MKLTPKKRQEFKAKAHSLKPIILIGNNGFSDAVSKETDRARHDHELIKIKIALEDRDARKAMIEEIRAAMSAEVVQQIGKVVVLYRKSDKE